MVTTPGTIACVSNAKARNLAAFPGASGLSSFFLCALCGRRLPRPVRSVTKNPLPNPHRSICPSYFASLRIAALLARVHINIIPWDLRFLCFHTLTNSLATRKALSLLLSGISTLLWQKHPGWGRPPEISRTSRYPLLNAHYSLLTVPPHNFYPPASDLRHNPAAQGRHPQPIPRAGRIQ
jgi:hypothetical protein